MAAPPVLRGDADMAGRVARWSDAQRFHGRANRRVPTGAFPLGWTSSGVAARIAGSENPDHKTA